MLLELKAYLSTRKIINLKELSAHFAKDPELMRQMLTHWIRKGKVCLVAKPNHCGSSCQMCQPEIAEIYQWLD